MKSSMVRSLLQRGIQRCKNVPRCVTVPVFSNEHQIRSIALAPSMTQTDSLFRTNELREMMALWPSVVKELTENGPYVDIPEVMKWTEKLLEYTVPNSQKLRAMAFTYAYHSLARPEQMTDEKLKLLRIMAWCYEMFQTCSLVIDDMIDRSEIRRGLPCWHLRNDVGIGALNDAFLLYEAAFQLLIKNFKKEEGCTAILETFHKALQIIALTQTQELLAAKRENNKLNLNLFTMDRCNSIMRYKAGSWVFYRPVKLVMHFLGIPHSDKLKPAMKLLVDMGMFYQVQDDYMDVYGDLKALEEISTDIQEGKCTWLIVEALQRASPSQRQLLEECFGSDDPEKVARVKQLFDDLELPKIYANREEEHYKLIKTRIQQISCGFPQELLFKFFYMNYRRNK